MNRWMHLLVFALALGISSAGAAAPSDLPELLEQVRNARTFEQKLNKEREARFLVDKEKQAQLLAEASAQLKAAEQQSETLKEQFDVNERRLSQLETTLRKWVGTLGELFGTVRQVSGDLKANVEASIVSAQFPDRTTLVDRLAHSRELPSIGELEELWFLLQQEMTESGNVVRFPARIVAADGTAQDTVATRIGTFNAVADGRFLRYLPEAGQLVELARQPPARLLKMAVALETATEGVVPMALDPTRGAILGLLVQTPDLRERLRQGGAVGYVILALGAIGLLIVIERLSYLGTIGARVRKQLARIEAPKKNNPLGRVLAVYDQHAQADLPSIERKLDEAILKETPRIERGKGLIKLLSAVAPLLGLLGTVVGMIATFQSITLFGTGDPKLMAGGISQALVTTAQGLAVAIPLVFLHSLVAARSKALIQILDEQSAGLIAQRAEKELRDGLPA